MRHDRASQARINEASCRVRAEPSAHASLPIPIPAHPILHLQQTIGNQAVQRLLRSRTTQAKLSVSQPCDIYEQEADRVAEHVMRMPAPAVQRTCSVCAAGGSTCSKCETEKPRLVQRKTEHSSDTGKSVSDNFLHDLGPGRRLDAFARAYFEPRFGRDFSRVRVHTDTGAAESARAVNALAYTAGREIVFGAERYAPGTHSGKKLLAHELTHVVQQSAGGGLLQAQRLNQRDADKFEREAESFSGVITALSPDDVSGAPLAVNNSPVGVMRTPDEAATKKCLDDCETRFDDCLAHTRFPPECIARRSVCQASCEPAQGKAAEAPKAIKIEDLTLESRGRKEKVDPSKVSSGIWWLNGETPTLYPLYPTEQNINTGLTPAGNFQYEVTKGADKLALLSGAAETSKLTLKDAAAVRVRGIGASSKPKDVTIQITHTPPKAKVSSVYSANLEVRAPNRLDGLTCSYKANGAEGYTSIFQATVKDNFGAPMPYIDFNEDFDAGTLAPGVTGLWGAAVAARTKGHSITLGDAVIEDHYEAEISGGKAPPDMAPRPSNPKTPLGDALVASFSHRWYVGTQKTGKGVQVSTHIGKFFADHGAYTNFVSPLSPRGKPDECPKAKAP